jgi:hypothetical protein
MLEVFTVGCPLCRLQQRTPQPAFYVLLPSNQKVTEIPDAEVTILFATGKSDDCIGVWCGFAGLSLCNLSAKPKTI